MSKILIVDDEPDIVEFQKSYLKKRRYDVISAKNINEAIEAIKKESPDVVFCDVRLETDAAGLTILEEAKKIKPEMAIYLITGLIDKNIQEKGLTLGAKDILTKPVSNDVLLNKIKEVIH